MSPWPQVEAQASQIGTVPGGGPDPTISTALTLSVATISTQTLAKTALRPQVGVASVAAWPSSVSRTTGYGLDPPGSHVAFGGTMDHWHHYPGCGRAMDLDMVLSSSPGFDVTRAQAMQFGMAPGGSPVPWHCHDLQWYQEPQTSIQTLATVGPWAQTWHLW